MIAGGASFSSARLGFLGRRFLRGLLKNDLGDLDSIVRASQRDLEAIAGVGAVRAREIREGLRRLQEHNLVERYLHL